MVNRLWCEIVIPILWRNPWCYDIDYSNKNYLFLIITSYLPDNIKGFLLRQGIQLPYITYRPLFDYLSFCRSINVNTINIITSIESSLAYNQFLLQQEFYSLFMRKFSELKYLDIKSIKHQIFYYPEARLRFESLCELKCDTSIDFSYFYGLAGLCQFIQRLIINNHVNSNNYHGIAKLIEVQKNLKYFKWKDDHDLVDLFYDPGPDSYKEILLALEKNENTITHLNIYFMFINNPTLPKALRKFHNLKTLITSFANFSEEQLKMCVYRNLEIFRTDQYELKAASIIIENSGGYINKILLKPYEFDDYIDNFIEDSLVLIRSIRKNCPLIEYLTLIFSPSKDHLNELEKLLNICQSLKSLLLVAFDYTDYSNYNEKILENGENILKILTNSTSPNIKEIRFCGDFEFSLEILEEFLKNWKGRSLSIITSNYIYKDDDYNELINKYKNIGVIRDFICESYINITNMNFEE
ncbi:hypothetical protein RclHR1_01390002 [Rhizophagus clarus]|uniref:F-box domain-containing protein n=1 Tax=Rhizophagus clarus TaxID=94130 RepID=A0A2Z6QFN8_9GLOM|nr:hypothetical protein RclHR1_01390002 [Rhizophagus clarus]GET04875.1 hypothetical protein GLOIN_2v1764011 [Rhizophagus clarus]